MDNVIHNSLLDSTSFVDNVIHELNRSREAFEGAIAPRLLANVLGFNLLLIASGSICLPPSLLILMDKQDLLLAVAQKRQTTSRLGYSQISDFHDGAYECDFVSPYTKSAGNVDAEVFVLLQDWCSEETFRTLDSDCIHYGLKRKLATNKRLVELLREHFSLELGDVYGTNLFPLIKRGNISSSIPMPDLVWAAHEFVLPQIRIVCPKLVVCLGLETFRAIRTVCKQKDVENMDEAVASPFTFGEARIWCQAHPGFWGQNNRGRDRVEEDWNNMKIDFLREA